MEFKDSQSDVRRPYLKINKTPPPPMIEKKKKYKKLIFFLDIRGKVRKTDENPS